jgi:hypothetical protein
MAWAIEVEERRARKAQIQAQAQNQIAPAVKLEPQAMTVGVKHTLEPESSADGAKRAKLEAETSGWTRGPDADVSVLPLRAVMDGVIEGLRGISSERLRQVMAVGSAFGSRGRELTCSLQNRL